LSPSLERGIFVSKTVPKCASAAVDEAQFFRALKVGPLKAAAHPANHICLDGEK